MGLPHAGSVEADEVDARLGDAPVDVGPVPGRAVLTRRLDAVFREETPLLSPIADELSARSMVAIVASGSSTSTTSLA